MLVQLLRKKNAENRKRNFRFSAKIRKSFFLVKSRQWIRVGLEHDEFLLASFKVDIVLTHCAPEEYIGENIPVVFNSDLSRILGCHMADVVDRSGNRLTRFLDSLITDCGLKFDHWYFGHYHRDIDWDKFSLMFNRVKVLVF